MGHSSDSLPTHSLPSSSAGLVTSTASVIPVTLVLCAEGSSRVADSHGTTDTLRVEGTEVQQSEGEIGVDGIQYVAYSTADQDRTSNGVLTAGLSSGVSGQEEVIGRVEEEEVVATVGREEEVEEGSPSLNTRSRRKRQSAGRQDSSGSKKSRRKGKEGGGVGQQVMRHPQEWSVEEVVEFVSNVLHCEHSTAAFREHVSWL